MLIMSFVHCDEVGYRLATSFPNWHQGDSTLRLVDELGLVWIERLLNHLNSCHYPNQPLIFLLLGTSIFRSLNLTHEVHQYP